MNDKSARTLLCRVFSGRGASNPVPATKFRLGDRGSPGLKAFET